MEEPWIVKPSSEIVVRKSQAKPFDLRTCDVPRTRGGTFILTFLFSSCLYFNTSCHLSPKTMETRGTVKGILRDQSGKPINDAIVMIVSGPADFNDMASVSNDNGEFKLPNVVIPGNYVLQIQNNGQQKRKEVNLQNKDSVISITF